jgi:hypothetical protein
MFLLPPELQHLTLLHLFFLLLLCFYPTLSVLSWSCRSFRMLQHTTHMNVSMGIWTWSASWVFWALLAQLYSFWSRVLVWCFCTDNGQETFVVWQSLSAAGSQRWYGCQWIIHFSAYQSDIFCVIILPPQLLKKSQVLLRNAHTRPLWGLFILLTTGIFFMLLIYKVYALCRTVTSKPNTELRIELVQEHLYLRRSGLA